MLAVLFFSAYTVVSAYVGNGQNAPELITSVRVKRPVRQPQQLKITVGGRTVTALLIDSPTTRDFIKLLPLTLMMSDINHREKYSGLSGKLSEAGIVKTTYQIGDLSYWLGGGLAAFYNHDGREVKAGLIVLARLEKNIALFNVAGSVEVTFDVVTN